MRRVIEAVGANSRFTQKVAVGGALAGILQLFAPPASAGSSKYGMSSKEIVNTIGANDVLKDVHRGAISYVHRSNYAANVPICEDTDIIDTEMPQADGALFGVFDGHAGHQASYFLREEISKWLQHFHSSGRTTTLLDALPIVEADNAFLQRAIDSKSFGDGIAGACYVLAHVQGPKISVAWAGDCRAVIGRRDASESKYQCISMTNDHQIDTNANERRRLLAEHPNEPDVILHSRVKGRLQPTRGFGDGAYKNADFYYLWVWPNFSPGKTLNLTLLFSAHIAVVFTIAQAQQLEATLHNSSARVVFTESLGTEATGRIGSSSAAGTDD